MKLSGLSKSNFLIIDVNFDRIGSRSLSINSSKESKVLLNIATDGSDNGADADSLLDSEFVCRRPLI